MAVAIAALRYENARSAGGEYEAMKAWAAESCGTHSWVRWGNQGMMECGVTDAYNKTFFKENWIVDVFVFDSAAAPPGQFIEEVLDAITHHWETLE